ncbi:MAG: DUF4339 domain-containing protein [Bacteroidota bacterium]|nr:DUF4339 domain-containing protein [Bacteroidota bacterium]
MEKIYVLKSQKFVKGPYSYDFLKNNGINYSDMIWHEGLADWIPAGQVEQLKDVISTHEKKEPSSLIDKLISFLR